MSSVSYWCQRSVAVPQPVANRGSREPRNADAGHLVR
jgi:hypothetical protein